MLKYFRRDRADRFLRSFLFGAIFIPCVFFSFHSLLAKPPADPAAMKNQADNQVQIALQLVSEADNMVNSNRTREGMRAALALYVRAGQMAEQANNVFKALAPRRASENDVKISSALVQRCVNSIKEVQKVM